MKIRTKLLVSHGLVALVMGCICVLVLLGLNAIDTSRRSLEQSYENLRIINELNSDTNRISEQIAELFIVGSGGYNEMIEAYDALLTKLARFRTETQGKRDRLPPDERQNTSEELDWIDALHAEVVAHEEIGRRIFALLDRNARETAEQLYAQRVENNLDNRIKELIDDALDRNARGVTAEIYSWNQLTERQRYLALSIMLAGALMAVGTALSLDRLVSRPLMKLADAADSLAEGRSEITLDTRRSDELGDLAERFREMVQRISQQRARLHAARDSLAEQVAERTESLSQRSEELEHANARLRELDSSRTRFLAEISHELRTPLTVMRGQAEVALRSPDASPELLRATMEAMVRKTSHLGRLVSDLLFLTRSEAGAIPINLCTTVLQETLAEVSMDARSLRAGDGIRIALHQPSDPVLVEADPARLHQAVMIVLDNAIQHAPQGSTVSIELQAGQGHARLAISDMGEGFDQADIPHVFDRFYRGRGNRGDDGSGLGLAIAQRIIARHRGRITILRGEHVTKGARVEITLPLLTAPTPPALEGGTR